MRPRLAFLTVFLGATLTLGCAGTTPTPVASPSSAVAAPAVATTAVPDSVHWVRNSAEHRAAFLQAFRLGAEVVEERAAGLAAGTWAVVLDADETILDNSTYQKEIAAASGDFDAATWSAWVERRAATALPGAALFLDRVRALGGRIAIVTNRTVAQCPATEEVLQAQGLVFDLLLCRGADHPKDSRWKAIEDGTAVPGVPPLAIVLFVGDNILDFPGLDQDDRSGPEAGFDDFGRRFLVLPNPMYGSWVKNPRE